MDPFKMSKSAQQEPLVNANSKVGIYLNCFCRKQSGSERNRSRIYKTSQRTCVYKCVTTRLDSAALGDIGIGQTPVVSLGIDIQWVIGFFCLN